VRPQKLPQVLPLETLKTFMTLGIEAPKGSEDVPRAIAAVEAKKAEYEEKRDKAAAEPPSEEEEPVEVRVVMHACLGGWERRCCLPLGR
jgi:hypothetical protein